MAFIEYKCPACGGPISFDSNIQQCQCPYCETIFDIKELKQQLLNVDLGEKEEKVDEMYTAEGLTVYTCKSCGGEIIGDENMAATSCPFCNNNVILSSKLSGMLKPDLVIPFKYTKEMAQDALRNHVKGKKLLPKVFKDENHIKEIKGIYVPYWLYDGEIFGNFQYNATKTNVWSDVNYNYTKTNYYRVNRSGSLRFHAIPHDGSSKIKDELMESIEPFDVSQAKPFDPSYLAGYYADKYDVTKEQAQDRVFKRMEQTIHESVTLSVTGYASVNPESGSTKVQNVDVKYALYPVWLLTTIWNGENYKFAMNGQNGKFVGDLPEDKGLARRYYFLYAISITVIAFIILMVIFYFIR